VLQEQPLIEARHWIEAQTAFDGAAFMAFMTG
jgi:hypothetical protein